MIASPSNIDAQAAEASEPAEFDRLLADFLDLDRNRFHARQTRARADAGPSLMGGPRGIDHWTYGFVRRHVDDCLREATEVTLAYAGERAFVPADLIPAFRLRLQRYFGELFLGLEADLTAPAANEYGVRPSRAALAEVRRYADERLRGALTGLARGRLDDRLALRHGLLARLWLRYGGSQRAFLALVILLFVAAMWSVL